MSLGMVRDYALESEMDVVGHCRRECQGDAASTGPCLRWLQKARGDLKTL